MKKLYVSPAEFAAAAGLRVEHVWRLCREGQLPSRRFGRWVRIPATALLDPEPGQLEEFPGGEGPKETGTKINKQGEKVRLAAIEST